MVDLRAGVTANQVYRRPFVTHYTALAKDLPFSDALDRAENRLEQIGGFDLQQTYAEAARDAMLQLPADSAPSGWRRVLVGEENCALCVVARPSVTMSPSSARSIPTAIAVSSRCSARPTKYSSVRTR
jgi:hypothetical protein